MSSVTLDPESVIIIGVGHVGLAKGVGLLGHGHHVQFVDTSATRREELRSLGLSCDAEVELLERPQIIFVCVPTPADTDGYDLSVLEDVVRGLGTKFAAGSARHLVAICSTVPPGTTSNVVAPLLEEACGRPEGIGFDVAAVPEFIREVSALDDTQRPWMTVVASKDIVARERLAMLFTPFGGEVRVFDDPLAAELVKVTHNAFNAAKISFFNELHAVADALGVDGHQISEVVARSAEASFNPLYGIRGGAPFRGHCLPKDLDGLIAFAADHQVPVPLLQAVRTVNQSFDEPTRRGASSSEHAPQAVQHATEQ